MLGAKIGALREILEHLAELMGAREEAVIYGRGHLQCLKLMPLRVQRADEVVDGIDAAARGEAAAVGQLVASREGGRDRATDFGGITGVNHAQSRINWHRPAAATIRQSLRRHHVVEVLEVHRWHLRRYGARSRPP